MKGLSAVVARDAESVRTMDEALDVVRARIVVGAIAVVLLPGSYNSCSYVANVSPN